ncbi:MAG: hypothetical protein BAJATHORv1_90038 [Candidatus Thorarchaeota archaeon]|nr:MAG: hypothetical protein BAJATHORv1_90038 [Candidatus Thorarchaeota archaeon]
MFGQARISELQGFILFCAVLSLKTQIEKQSQGKGIRRELLQLSKPIVQGI